MAKKLSDAQLQQRREVNLVHGGAGATRRIVEGRELVGVARQAELDVYNELETEGRVAIIRRDAARLQAACDLYWNAVEKAVQDGDLVKLDHYIQRFGWLSSASIRAWVTLKDEENRPAAPIDAALVLAALTSPKEGEHDNGNK